MCAAKEDLENKEDSKTDDDLPPLHVPLPLLLALSAGSPNFGPLGALMLPLFEPPGIQKANRIKRTALREKYGPKVGRFRETTGNVAAIDFGTTFCSLAYTTSTGTVEPSPAPKINTLQLNEYYGRVPTAILLKQRDDGNLQNIDEDLVARSPIYDIKSFGYFAQEQYRTLHSSHRGEWMYFERFKMNLQQDEGVNRNLSITASNGTKCYLVEVIAFILRYLKDQLIDHLKQSGSDLRVADFDWVITVPAIWKSRGKRMMREAAYLAGLCSGDRGIERFIKVGYGVPRPTESNPDKLTLALEPEAAAVYCQTMNEQAVPEHCHITGPFQSNRYLVIDIGGGTVDITAHRHEQQHGIEVIAEPIGNDCGGMKVNKEFAKLLHKIVNDDSFCRYLTNGDPGIVATRKAIINSLLNKDFDTAKVTFGSKACGLGVNPQQDEDNEMYIQLPNEFVSFYGIKAIENGVKALKDKRVELDENVLYIKPSLACELFKPAIDGILDCSAKVLDRLKGDIDTIYLVGGFGGCKYVYEKIFSLNKEKFKDYNIRIIVPKDHSLAVAMGAVKYRLNPDIIHSRVMDATYGTDICPPFVPGRHDFKYCIGRDSHGILRRRDVLLHYVDKGEVLSSDEIVTAELSPLSDNATKMKIDLYSTFDSDVEYIKDENKTPIASIRKIGHIEIDMPNDSLPREKRIVEMTMDFSHTEIQVRARYTVTGTEVKTTIDFLTDEFN